MISVFDRVENIVEKGENAGYQHFLLFPQGFQKVCFFFLGSLNVGIEIKKSALLLVFVCVYLLFHSKTKIFIDISHWDIEVNLIIFHDIIYNQKADSLGKLCGKRRNAR